MHAYEKLLKLLIDYKVEFVLIGGFAAVVHGCTMLTQDIDSLIRSKKEMGRPKDKETILQLKAIKTQSD